MAKPNYGFEKRQRELAKKRKKEEKALRKASPGESAQADPAQNLPPAEGGGAPQQPQPQD